jgi:multisubunit Na+/H+ antiporter MnhB subunit
MLFPCMAEYYIRQPGTEEARGPFDEDKMTTLAEAGQVTVETLYYDEAASNWVPVGGNAALKALLFPERHKLGLKKSRDESIQLINKPEDAVAPAITVNQMLAAAEGESKETKHLTQQRKMEERAGALALPVLTVMMVLSGLANTVPHYDLLHDVVLHHKFPRLLEQPFVVVGLLDFFLALCLFLNVNGIFPLVRFRAMLGLGYFAFVYWSLGDPSGLIAAVAAGLGLFVCTITLNFYLMVVFAILGVLGMGSQAWVAWTASAAS